MGSAGSATRLARVSRKRQRIPAECLLSSQFHLSSYFLGSGADLVYRYDVSEFQLEDIKEIELDDQLFKSSRYLKEKGMPVVALSGKFFSPPLPYHS